MLVLQVTTLSKCIYWSKKNLRANDFEHKFRRSVVQHEDDLCVLYIGCLVRRKRIYSTSCFDEAGNHILDASLKVFNNLLQQKWQNKDVSHWKTYKWKWKTYTFFKGNFIICLL